jgi:hypothetical protein
MRFILLTAFLAIGCGGDKAAQQERRVADERALAAAVAKDRPALVKRAVADMRKMLEREFGAKNGAAAVIAADESGIKDFGGDKWDVNGTIEGLDKDGRAFTAPFTVTLQILQGKLNTNVVELKRRTYKDGPKGK